MIIGAQKCGTSTLFNILDSHPGIVGSRPKEPQFFSTSPDWRKEIDDYHKLFNQKEGVLYLEASTTYTFYPLRNLRIWEAIYEYNPKMKFIYLVRNPIDRVISSYMHAYERGFTDLAIEEAVTERRQLIDVTRYYTQIRPYIKKFGSDRVLIIDFEDFIKKREAVLLQIADFMSIDYSQFANHEKVHTNASLGGGKKHHKYDKPSLPLKVVRKFLPPLWDRMMDNSRRAFARKPELSPEYREMIINMLELEIRALEGLMDKDLSHWLTWEKPGSA